MSAQSIFFLIFFVFYIGVDSSEFENGENSNCEYGRAGSDFCCDEGCDEGCGGTGCGGWGNEEDVCCKSTIVAAPYNGRSCDTHPPPCILTITNGNCEMGKRNGDYCCDPGCVEGCGGSGCGNWGNAGSGCGEECDVCCSGAINASPYNGRSCSVYPPPCIIDVNKRIDTLRTDVNQLIDTLRPYFPNLEYSTAAHTFVGDTISDSNSVFGDSLISFVSSNIEFLFMLCINILTVVIGLFICWKGGLFSKNKVQQYSKVIRSNEAEDAEKKPIYA